MIAIFKKELRGYFLSPLGWLFLAFYFVFLGIYVYIYNITLEYANFAYALDGVAKFFLLLIPMLTMRTFAEERRQRTDQLLLTAPVSCTGVVLGKFLALSCVALVANGVSAVYPFVLRHYGNTDFSIAYSTLAAFFLMGTAYMAIGMFLSALTESQVVAAVVTFIVILFTWVIDLVTDMIPTDARTALFIWLGVAVILSFVLYRLMRSLPVAGGAFAVMLCGLLILFFRNREMLDGSVGRVFGWFSLLSRYENFKYGLMAPAAFVYYISINVLFVFLTVQALNKRRWSE